MKTYNIFILENNSITRQLLHRYFATHRQFQLFQAATTDRALQLVQDVGASIDLFLVDFDLPDGRGLDFLEYTQPYEKAKFILISDYNRQDLKELGYRREVLANLQKPLQLPELDLALSFLSLY